MKQRARMKRVSERAYRHHQIENILEHVLNVAVFGEPVADIMRALKLSKQDVFPEIEFRVWDAERQEWMR